MSFIMMNKQEILAEAHSVAEQVRSYRRHIHENPELSFQEFKTGDYIISILEQEGIKYRRVAETGVLAFIEGQGDLNDALILRADMDALPINEASGESFASRNEGVMHACGHDMHTSVLLGALIVINRNRHKLHGTTIGLFQPGEELCPGGASIVLKEDPFKDYNVRAIIGEHVDPDLATGTFGFRPGKYMASSDEIRIKVLGEGGHAAMPDKVKDPVVASAALILALQQIVSRNGNPLIPTVLSIGKVLADGATNVIPDEVSLEGTLRTFDETWRAEAKKRIRQISSSVAEAYGLNATVVIDDGYPSVVNSEELTEKARRIIGEIYDAQAVKALDMRPTAEDFGFYTKVYPSLFYRFGVGGSVDDLSLKKVGKLHTSHFCPDEKALEYAVAGFVGLAMNILS